LELSKQARTDHYAEALGIWWTRGRRVRWQLSYRIPPQSTSRIPRTAPLGRQQARIRLDRPDPGSRNHSRGPEIRQYGEVGRGPAS